ncbi:unannotated protein [freshwater metagenome]|uniref:Unannotated protein n=1 Tax=freshwater metagenome TaxID=449393 RepID=A0A6J7KRN0_9ZZZZ
MQEHDIRTQGIAEEHRHQAQTARDVVQPRAATHPGADERRLIGHALAVRYALSRIEHVEPVLGNNLVDGAEEHLRGREVPRGDDPRVCRQIPEDPLELLDVDDPH